MKASVKFVLPPEPTKKEIAQLKCQGRCMKIALIIATALLSGCMTPTTATTEQNFYETTYRSNTVGATKEQIAAAFYPSAKDPQIIRTNLRDANSVFQSLKTQGYQPIGISQFTTWIVQKDSDLIHAAKKVDADLVVTLAYFAGRKVVQFPFKP